MSEEPILRLRAALASRYVLHEQIGAGGMATVYRAKDKKHERPVAIKSLRPELAAALGPERFLREIQITAQLNHPHILPLLDSGEAGGLLFYVMPYVEGESLRDRLNREPQLPIADVVQITREIAAALSYAHDRDVVHRDIKPENIMLSGGVATLADFGIAQAVSHAGGERLTETGIAVGTVTYMSPEQVAGSRTLDGRSDQYSLACVVYEMVAGQPPFSGPTAESVARQHLAAEATSLTTLRQATPDHVAMAIERAMTKSPADRWRTMSEFADMVSQADTHMTPARAGKRLKVSLAAVVAALLIVIALSAVLLGREGTPSEPGRVVIIPFDNETGQGTLDPLGRMAAEWISQQLARTGFVDVVDALTMTVLEEDEAMRAAAARGERISELAKATGASVVVAGAYYQDRDSLQFRTRIVDADEGTLLTSLAPSVGSAQDLMGLVSRLADDVVSALAPVLDTRLASWEGESGSLPQYAAYEAYLRGVTAFVRNQWGEAVTLFQNASDLDSSFHRAALWQAHTVAMFSDGAERARELLDRVEASQDRLSRYDRERIKYVRALITWDVARAYEGARAMLEAAPASIDAKRETALLAQKLNRVEEAIRLFREMDPTEGVLREWSSYWLYLGLAFHQAGRFEDEVELSEEARSVGAVEEGMLSEVRGLIGLGQAENARSSLNRLVERALSYRVTRPYEEWDAIMVRHAPTILLSMGREFRAHGFAEEARNVFQEGVDLLRSTEGAVRNAYDAEVLGQLYYELGRFSEAQTVLETVPFQHEDYIIAQYLGAVAARRGDTARAQAIEDRILQTEYPAWIDRNKRIGVAHIAVLLGEPERAVELLRGIGFPVDRRFGDLHLQADFEPLLGNPAFDALVAAALGRASR